MRRALALTSLLLHCTPDGGGSSTEALIGLANTQQIQGDAKSAKKSLETVVAQYPGTPAADIARQRLKQQAAPKK